ncbi:hypothetical protein chiPu_0025111, partial [Chiloscyllium punctatum]|nr:hypothetical protein [Chiloscyllium punctatum]
ALKWKVLVKGKRIGQLEDYLDGQGEDHDTGEVTDEDEAAEVDDENIKNEVKRKGKVKVALGLHQLKPC